MNVEKYIAVEFAAREVIEILDSAEFGGSVFRGGTTMRIILERDQFDSLMDAVNVFRKNIHPTMPLNLEPLEAICEPQ